MSEDSPAKALERSRLNREARFPDNDGDPVQSISNRAMMRHEETNKGPRLTRGTWSRHAIVGLWLVGFLLAGGVLSARWDVLMARLARPPLADVAAEGAQ